MEIQLNPELPDTFKLTNRYRRMLLGAAWANESQPIAISASSGLARMSLLHDRHR